MAATDSAVPTAILLDIARAVTQYYEDGHKVKTGLQLIFFDGGSTRSLLNWTHEIIERNRGGFRRLDKD